MTTVIHPRPCPATLVRTALLAAAIAAMQVLLPMPQLPMPQLPGTPACSPVASTTI
jgi:hypothetical protein